MHRVQAVLALAALSLSCARGGDGNATGVATFADTSAGPADTSTSGADDDADPSTGDGNVDTTAAMGSDSSTGAPDEPPDLQDGTWVFDNVSMTVGISLHPRRAQLDDGREIVAWAQSNPRDISNINIMSAEGLTTGRGAWTVSNVTAIDEVQNTFPWLAGGNRALLAWAGQTNEGADYDVHLVRSQGSSWSPPENISTMFEDPQEPLNDTELVILRRTDGGVAIAYMAILPPASKFDPPSVPEIFVTKFFEDNAPSARIPLNPAGANCSGIAGATAPSGVFHVALSCNDAGESLLVHATDRSGDWDTDELNGVTSGVLSPSMGAGPEGAHLVWIQNVACGDEDCSEVFHMATGSEEVFGSPTQVTDTANLNERQPAVGVDRWGRVLVVSQARVDGTARLYLSVAEDGETFGESERISPDAVDDYQTPADFAFDEDGYPSFVTEVALDGTDPLNVEIYRARFVPN